MKDHTAIYWFRLWMKASNGVLALQADMTELKQSIGEAINEMGGPAMDYAPAIANRERQQKIDKAAKILIRALQKSNKRTKR